jgi:ParB family chromosome partitioning protein
MAIVTRTQTLKITEIKPTKPNRSLSTAHVKDLAESLSNTSFATAVVVRPTEKEGEYAWVVVAGFHRIEAAKAAGKAEIHVIVVENATDLELELLEIDENILHRPLTIVQEARALARRKKIFQELNPGTGRGGDRRSNVQSGSLKNSFAKVTAAATGRSETAVNRAVARADKISDAAMQMVEGTPVETGAFLDTLAKVPAAEQEAFVANALAKPPEPTNTQIDVEADLARLRRCWAQSCAEARTKFLTEVGGSTIKKATPAS